jgi:hypothetical protein
MSAIPYRSYLIHPVVSPLSTLKASGPSNVRRAISVPTTCSVRLPPWPRLLFHKPQHARVSPDHTVVQRSCHHAITKVGSGSTTLTEVAKTELKRQRHDVATSTYAPPTPYSSRYLTPSRVPIAALDGNEHHGNSTRSNRPRRKSSCSATLARQREMAGQVKGHKSSAPSPTMTAPGNPNHTSQPSRQIWRRFGADLGEKQKPSWHVSL